MCGTVLCIPLSFPLRERGLKQRFYTLCGVSDVSFPLRERGLKHIRHISDSSRNTSFPLRERGLKPRLWGHSRAPIKSFPLRERGLKQTHSSRSLRHTLVVPLAGTWIETCPVEILFHGPALSFPLRERGLKHLSPPTSTAVRSFPLRERGLKLLLLRVRMKILLVIPLAGT